MELVEPGLNRLSFGQTGMGSQRMEVSTCLEVTSQEFQNGTEGSVYVKETTGDSHQKPRVPFEMLMSYRNT